MKTLMATPLSAAGADIYKKNTTLLPLAGLLPLKCRAPCLQQLVRHTRPLKRSTSMDRARIQTGKAPVHVVAEANR